MSDELSAYDDATGAYMTCVCDSYVKTARAAPPGGSFEYLVAAYRACKAEEEELKNAWLDFFVRRAAGTSETRESLERVWPETLADIRKEAARQAREAAFADEFAEAPPTPDPRATIEPPRGDPA